MMTKTLLTRTLLAAALAGATLLTACGGGSGGGDTSTSASSNGNGTGNSVGNATQVATGGGSSTTSTGSTGGASTGSTGDSTGATTSSTDSTDATATTSSATAAADDLAQIAAVQPLQSAIGLPGTAVLSWKATANVVSYRVYYGTSSRSYQQPLGAGMPAAVTALTVNGLTSGQTYYFSVTGIDANGKETAYSDEMTKQVS